VEWIIAISVALIAICLARPLILKLGDTIDGPDD